MTAIASSITKKQLTAVVIFVIVVVAGIFLWKVHVSSNQRKPSKDVALAMAKAIYSGNSGSCRYLWSKDMVKHSIFPQTVSPRVQEYGPVKEVALVSQENAVLEGHPTKISSWKVTAQNGSYTIMINVKDRELVGCRLVLPSGESVVTGCF